MDSSWMEGLYNLGGAVVVTFLFLVYLYKSGGREKSSGEKVARQIENIQETFLEHNKTQSEQAREGFLEHNKTLTDSFLSQTETFLEHNRTLTTTFAGQIETLNSQFREVMQENFGAIGEMIRAITSLQTAVTSLQTALVNLQSYAEKTKKGP